MINRRELLQLLATAPFMASPTSLLAWQQPLLLQLPVVLLRRWTKGALDRGVLPQLTWSKFITIDSKRSWDHLDELYATWPNCIAIGHYFPKALPSQRFIHWSEGGLESDYSVRFRRLVGNIETRCLAFRPNILLVEAELRDTSATRG
jgi:hypothetical protein